MIEILLDPANWVALATLTALEIVLGIDNIVFIAILTARLPPEQRSLGYRLGLGGALVTRLGLLFALSWIMGLTAPLFSIAGEELSGRDLILLAGGLFLIGKSAQEIYVKVELHDHEGHGHGGKANSLVSVVTQIALLDIVFSLDSVITAVGMVKHVPIMVVAIVVAIVVMLVFAERIGTFVNQNPSIKILALSFLMLIGVLLTAEAFDQHISRGYVYFAMGYAFAVEVFNLRRERNLRKTSPPNPTP
ncbi:MAG: TerC family protein [Myxococcales bacterium]|nr:TerC family protein [Myxococcales bacterium]